MVEYIKIHLNFIFGEEKFISPICSKDKKERKHLNSAIPIQDL